jgi:hypothetical protein
MDKTRVGFYLQQLTTLLHVVKRQLLCYASGMAYTKDLALADQHIVQAEGRITLQLQRIEHMAAKGQDTALAWNVLSVMKQSLLMMHVHRQLILAELA